MCASCVCALRSHAHAHMNTCTPGMHCDAAVSVEHIEIPVYYVYCYADVRLCEARTQKYICLMPLYATFYPLSAVLST